MRLLAVLLVLLTAPAAFADEAKQAPPPEEVPAEPAPRIAVVIELAVNVDAARADELGAALADALNRELVVDAFGGTDVSRTLPEGGLPEECLGRPECVNDVAARLDAEQLLFLVVVQVGADVQVDCSWVDLATGVVSARPRVVLGSDARAVSVFAKAATRFLPDAEKRGPNTIVIGGGGGPIVPRGEGRHMTLTSWIFTGVGGAALIAGGILAVSARSSYERCDNLAGGCSDNTIDGIGHRSLAADISVAAALGCAVTTVILYLRSDTSASKPDEHAGLVVSPADRGALVGLSGQF
jgi:hypothetical protein